LSFYTASTESGHEPLDGLWGVMLDVRRPCWDAVIAPSRRLLLDQWTVEI
jgi:hypothetical protein